MDIFQFRIFFHFSLYYFLFTLKIFFFDHIVFSKDMEEIIIIFIITLISFLLWQTCYFIERFSFFQLINYNTNLEI